MKFFGGVLMAIGILIAGLSGLCSLLLLVDPSTWSGPSSGESLSIIAVVGGIPFVIGAGLILLGRVLMKQGAPPPPQDQTGGPPA